MCAAEVQVEDSASEKVNECVTSVLRATINLWKQSLTFWMLIK